MNSRHHPPLGARAAVQCSSSAIGCTSAASRPALPHGAWITPGVAVTSAYAPLARPRASRSDDRRRTYVLDTSVLLADPRALLRFDEHEVVLPIVVLTELEAKRDHPELGWAARRGAAPARGLPARARLAHRAAAGQRPRRHAAGRAQPPGHVVPAGVAHGRQQRPPHPGRGPQPRRRGPRRHRRHQGPAAAPQGLHRRARRRRVPQRAGRATPAGPASPSSTSTQRSSTSCSPIGSSTSPRPATCRATPASPWWPVRSRRSAGCTTTSGCTWCGATAASSTCTAGRAEQRIAIDLLADPSRRHRVDRRTRPAPARRVLALAAGLEAVLEQRTHKRVTVFRPIYAVGGQDLGFLPGTEAEKMNPWAAAVTDALEAIVGPGGDRRGVRAATCSRCCRSPTSGAAASPTPS